MRVIILEEDNKRKEKMEYLVRTAAERLKVIVCSRIEEAIRAALEEKIHLFIVDLTFDRERSCFTGISFIKWIRRTIEYYNAFVIVTSDLIDKDLIMYKEYHVYKYYERPFRETELQNDIKGLQIMMKLMKLKGMDPDDQYIMVKSEDSFYKIYLRDVLMIEKKSKYDVLYMKDMEAMKLPKYALKGLIENIDNLDAADFFYCNRSNIVNSQNLKKINEAENYAVLENMERTVPISEQGKEHLRKYLGLYQKRRRAGKKTEDKAFGEEAEKKVAGNVVEKSSIHNGLAELKNIGKGT